MPVSPKAQMLTRAVRPSPCLWEGQPPLVCTALVSAPPERWHHGCLTTLPLFSPLCLAWPLPICLAWSLSPLSLAWSLPPLPGLVPPHLPGLVPPPSPWAGPSPSAWPSPSPSDFPALSPQLLLPSRFRHPSARRVPLEQSSLGSFPAGSCHRWAASRVRPLVS